MSRRGGIRRRLLPALCAVMAATAVAAPLGAQSQRPEPRRPPLSAGADTNSAGAYMRLGTGLLTTNPKQAADAFYWVVRLDPERQEAVYARRIALLLQNPQRMARYMEGDRQVIRSADMRAADSLYLRSLMMNPFMLRGLDDLLLKGYAEEWARDIDSRPGARDPGATRYAIDLYLRRASPYMKAWFAYTERRFDDALRNYDQALRSSRNKAWLHAERAHILFVTGRFAEAEVAMDAAISEARKRDEKQVVHFYDSKALYEYSRGYILHVVGRTDEAIEAYGRALQEDLSFYPAHHRTAVLLLERGDTAAALGALALASAMETVDARTRLLYGMLLTASGDAAAGEAELAAVNRLEPYYAIPYAERGRALEALGRADAAIEAYTHYLERAPRTDPVRRPVADRIEALRRSLAPGAGS